MQHLAFIQNHLTYTLTGGFRYRKVNLEEQNSLAKTAVTCLIPPCCQDARKNACTKIHSFTQFANKNTTVCLEYFFFLESKVVVLFYSAVDVSLLPIVVVVLVGSSCREKRHIR